MLEMINEEDKERCLEIMREIEKGIKTVNKQYRGVLERMKEDGIDLKKGHPILSLLTREMSLYILNLTSVMVAKVQGLSLQQLPAVWQLVVSRTVIGKLWEAERKLKYELDKTSSRQASASSADNPLSLKPDISNFILKDDDGVENEKKGDDEEDDGGDDDDAGQVYRPSKQFPKYYDGDEDVGGRKAKRVMVKRSVLNDLRAEFTEQPMEIYDGTGVNRLVSRKKEEERTQYEESHFVRLQTSKKEKMAGKRMSAMADVLDFSQQDRGDNKKKKRKAFRGKKKSKKTKFH